MDKCSEKIAEIGDGDRQDDKTPKIERTHQMTSISKETLRSRPQAKRVKIGTIVTGFQSKFFKFVVTS
jgi:predicted subunit of tRNA(5-methylaminomethyl-2-thiouridylate) methyltransferase